MVGDLFRGAGYFFEGLGMITRPGLRRYIIIPLLINLMLFALLIIWLSREFGALVALYTPQLPEWLSWLGSVVWLLFTIIIAMMSFFTFTLVANIVAAPFNSLLAEAAERQLSGEAPSNGGWLIALREAPSMMLDAVRKLILFVLVAIPLLLLFVIPGINLLAPFIWGAFSAWILALEYLDYPLGNHSLRLKQQRELINQHRSLTLGFGIATLAATLIPFLNVLTISSATLGATVMWVKEMKHR